jgi:hypothetical protein
MKGPRRSGTRPQDFAVEELLDWIDKQDLVLPEFQRDYDWSDDRVIALVATMMRGWPAGSLLLQERGDATFFRVRSVDGGPPIDEDLAATVVLDGQQRLTGLFHALYDVGPSVYAIRADALKREGTIDGIEESLKAFDREIWDRDYRERGFAGGEDDWIPLYAARSAPDFFAWRDEIAQHSKDRETVALQISDAFRNGLERLHKFRFPAVIVESGLEPAAIARIFERVNRQGLALKTFDLMVARTYVPNWNLRDRWSDACDEYPVLERFFGDDGMPVIRAIALTSVENVREQAVLNLVASLVRLEWDGAVRAMADAMAFLESACGVISPDWVPYGGVVVTLAGIAREWDLKRHRTLLKRWVLASGLGLRFESGANTVTVDEFQRLGSILEGTEKLKQIPISARVLEEATRRRQGAVWRTFLCCLSLNSATKVGLGDKNDPSLSVSVFKKSDGSQGREPMHHLVLSQVVASKGDARKVGYKGIGALDRHLASLDPGTRRKIEKSQILSFDFSARSSEEQFIHDRLDSFDEWLHSVLGYGLDRSE